MECEAPLLQSITAAVVTGQVACHMNLRAVENYVIIEALAAFLYVHVSYAAVAAGCKFLCQ